MNKTGLLLATCALVVTSCTEVTSPISTPTNLTYLLQPSGDPLLPLGVLLEWDAVTDADLSVYNIFGKVSGSSQFDLRGSTTSTSFHDQGPIDVEYFVTAVNTDGDEGVRSDVVFIDELFRLESPGSIGSTSLDGAIHVFWLDNAFLNEPDGFANYRLYGATYNLDTDLCLDDWTLEGTTVAPEFLVSALGNGVPRCFGVSSESIEGWESLWSALIADTPRPDARNVLVWASQDDLASSGFRFFQDLNGDGLVGNTELGLIGAGNLATIDFVVDRSSGFMALQPVRTGTTVALYSALPVDDLTSIDVAPVSGFSAVGITAEPGFGYVFEMDGGDGFFRYGALRVTHVGSQFIIFDWAYQTDPGNPELSVSGGKTYSDGDDLVVTGRQ